MWPLAFLAVIPIIIILYLLKPRGTDTEISSNILWEKLFKNVSSKTFFEKFVQDLLMYLQILIMITLILALMAPQIMLKTTTGGSTVLVIDNSLSMQHTAADSRSRLDEAKARAASYVTAAGGDVSVISVSGESRILIASSRDNTALKNAISALNATDREGSFADAYQMIESLHADHVVIYTDGDGAEAAAEYAESLKAQVINVGKPVFNVSLDYMAMSEKGSAADGGVMADATVRYTNYADEAAGFELTFYDADGSILSVKPVRVEAGASASVLAEDINVKGDYISAKLSGVSYVGGKNKDSLAADDVIYALRVSASSAKGLLVSAGNSFVERAYFASTGTDLTRAGNDNVLAAGSYDVVIYDAGYSKKYTPTVSDKETESKKEATQRVNFFDIAAAGKAQKQNVLVNVADCELTRGLGEFTIGVNLTNTFDKPEWATSFMESGGECVGYYGINGDHKEVVIGFDIRESDFALKAEFPVVIAETVSYLADSHLLAKNSYELGEALEFNPSAEGDTAGRKIVRIDGGSETETVTFDKAGLYAVDAGDHREYFNIRLGTAGRDGRKDAPDISGKGNAEAVLAKQSLRNALLILAIVLLVIEWILYVRRMNYRKKFYLIARSVILLLVILALMGLKLPKNTKETTTVFLVDMSVSDTENLEAFDEYISNSLKKLPPNNRYAIISFGRDAVVEQFVTDRNMYMGLSNEADATATNFEMALQRASALLPSDTASRIVVLTDGRETAGNLENVKGLFEGGDISLEAVVIPADTKNDVYLSDVDMPDVLHQGEEYYITVKAQSNYDTNAVIEIYSGASLVATEEVTLKKGSNSFVFEEEVSEAALESYEVKIRAEGDGCAENDTYSAYSRVEEAPKVLVLRGSSENSAAFEKLLEAAHVNAEFVKASKAPDTLMEMLEYRTFILENVYRDELPNGFVDNLESYVKDYGGGFICCGGQDSYMIGGYNDTPIETVLPVNMELRGTLEIPSTAIVMVIDHSGSMDMYVGNGASYLDVAVEAAKRGVDNMRETDEVGVLAFDDMYTWAHRLSYVDDKEAIKDDIETIGSGGGTVIMPALEEARVALGSSDAQIRHIILLTDGYGETSDFSQVIDRIVNDGITLSTVAVGFDSDTQLMEKLANDAGGRYYFTDGKSDLPRIFAQEVYMGGDSYIKNGDYEVLTGMKHEITDGLFESGWMNILGYVAASPKEGSSQLLSSAAGDPLLTVWQYGLGKTVAWNTDADGKWTASYSGEDDYAALWKRIVDFTSGTPAIGDDYIETENKDGRTLVTYHTSSYQDSTTIDGMYTGPKGETGEVSFTAREPGVYETYLDTADTGLYYINVRRSDEGKITGAMMSGAVVQYSDEYRFDVSDAAFNSLVDTYGKHITLEDDPFTKLDIKKSARRDITPILIALAVMLLLFDIAGRRFGFEPAFRKKKRKPVAEEAEEVIEEVSEETVDDGKKKKRKTKKKAAPAEEELDTSALLKRKKDRNL